MTIIPREGVLLIKKHTKGQFKADITVEETDENKNLITGEILADWTIGNKNKSWSIYKPGTTVIFGKYALFALVLQGEKFYFIESKDVIGTADYKEV